MASFLELDNDNIVIRGISVANEVLLDANGVEQEELGKIFCATLLGGRWVQTSYNGRIRGRYAGIGYYYNESEDEFYPPPCRNRAEYEAELARIAALPKASSPLTDAGTDNA